MNLSEGEKCRPGSDAPLQLICCPQWMITSSSCDSCSPELINLRLIISKMQMAVSFVPSSINRSDWHLSFLVLYFSCLSRAQRLMNTGIAVTVCTSNLFYFNILSLAMPINYALKQNTRIPKTDIKRFFFYYSLLVNLCQEAWRHKTLHRMIFWQMWQSPRETLCSAIKQN